MVRTKYIAVILILIQIVPFNAYTAPKKNISMVIVPVRNGVSDAESEAAVGRLRSTLGADPKLHVVSQKNVDSVLQYYDRADDPTITEYTKLLSKAKEDYYRFNYIEAKSIVNKIISSIKDNPHSLYDHGGTLLDAYLTLGIISKSMGNVGEARQAFREALRLDPNYKLDSRAFSPTLVNAFEGVRSSLDIEPRGTIKVESKPKVADVYLNGILKGVAPLTISDLPQGVHYLKIAANKYKDVRRAVNVEGGKTVRIKEKLPWTAGKMGKLSGKNYVQAVEDISQIGEGLKIADLLKADKVVLVDVDAARGPSGVVKARMVDAAYRTGHKPIVMPYGDGTESLAQLAGEIASQTYVNIAKNPEKHSDPLGVGAPVLLGKKGRRKISKPVLFGILGGVLAAGLGGGLAAALAGGGGGGGGTGSVHVNFK